VPQDRAHSKISSAERSAGDARGKERAGYSNVAGFAVDYQLCRRCRPGWVEHPYTLPDHQRRGLARAGLVRLRTEHPGPSWPTLGGHSEAPSFWAAVGVDAPGRSPAPRRRPARHLRRLTCGRATTGV
jgi:hypothetical protein